MTTQPNALPSAAELTPEELAENRRYGQIQLLCDLADRAIDLAFLALMAFLVAPHIRVAMDDIFPIDTVRLLSYFLLTTALHVVVSLPLSYYSGHVLEHQFALSNLTPYSWLLRYFKQLGLYIVMMGLMFVGLYWVIWLFGEWWWMVGAVAFFVVNVLVGQLAPVLVLPLFYKIERINLPELTERLERVAAGTGLSIEGVYRMDLSVETKKANAMLAGFGRTRRVLLGDTALANFTPDEIEVVFAHEIGHHVHRHISKIMLIGLFSSAAGFWTCDRVAMAWARQFDPAVDYATFPVFTLPLMMLALRMFTLLLEPAVNTLSRHFERQSDRYALARTGLQGAYVSAYRKLARMNKDNPHPHSLEVFLFHSHPPMSERLAMAEGT